MVRPGRQMQVNSVQGHKALSRSINSTTPRRIIGEQLLSIPPHSYQLKLQKVVRFFVTVPGTGNVNVFVSDVRTAVRNELGTGTTTGYNEQFAVHQANFYAAKQDVVGAGTGATDLSVIAYNRLTTEVWGQYDDSATGSGIANIRIVYPVNERPTFATNSTGTAVMWNISSVGAAAGVVCTIDILVDYVKSSTVPFGILMRSLALGQPGPPHLHEPLGSMQHITQRDEPRGVFVPDVEPRQGTSDSTSR